MVYALRRRKTKRVFRPVVTLRAALITGTTTVGGTQFLWLKRQHMESRMNAIDFSINVDA